MAIEYFVVCRDRLPPQPGHTAWRLDVGMAVITEVDGGADDVRAAAGVVGPAQVLRLRSRAGAGGVTYQLAIEVARAGRGAVVYEDGGVVADLADEARACRDADALVAALERVIGDERAYEVRERAAAEQAWERAAADPATADENDWSEI